MHAKMKSQKKSLMWKIRKRYRWMRLNWFYLKRVLETEAEIGGELHAC